MKRLLAFILCGVLCLGLCACGSSGGSSRGEHDRLLEMLDEHEYQAAVNYINNLAYEYAQENKDPNEDEFVYTAALIGEWIAYDVKEGVTVPKVEFKDDGTCLIGENEYLWEVMDESKTHISINILNGAEQVHSLSLSKNTTNGTINANSSNIVKDKHINFYNPAHYEVVEITVDNWDDYFDNVDYYTFSTNSFGEVTDIYANSQWKLKETYYNRLWVGMTDIAVEYSYMNGKQPATWDLAAKTCQLTGEWTPNTKNPADSLNTRTEKLNQFGDSSTENPDDQYFGYRHFNCGGWAMDNGETYFGNYHKDTKLIRVQGSLWLVKENIKNLQKTEE